MQNFKLGPKTFFEELAIDNHLREYIDTNTTILKKYNEDKLFRDEMLHLLYIHSDSFQKDVEYAILEDLNNTLSYFLDKIETWNTNNQ